MLSSKLCNVEIIAIAMGDLYSHVKRPRWAMKFLERKNARYENFLINSEGLMLLFPNWVKYEKAVEYFMQNTAANEEIFSKTHMKRCYWFFDVGFQIQAHKNSHKFLKSPPSGKPYLSGGKLIAKVLAFKKFEYAFGELLKGMRNGGQSRIFTNFYQFGVRFRKMLLDQRFVLKREMMELDYEERLFSIPNSVVIRKASIVHFHWSANFVETESEIGRE